MAIAPEVADSSSAKPVERVTSEPPIAEAPVSMPILPAVAWLLEPVLTAMLPDSASSEAPVLISAFPETPRASPVETDTPPLTLLAPPLTAWPLWIPTDPLATALSPVDMEVSPLVPL
jgi:hypothetical protein